MEPLGGDELSEASVGGGSVLHGFAEWLSSCHQQLSGGAGGAAI